MRVQGLKKILLAGLLSFAVMAESFSGAVTMAFASEQESISSDSVSADSVWTVSDGAAADPDEAVAEEPAEEMPGEAVSADEAGKEEETEETDEAEEAAGEAPDDIASGDEPVSEKRDIGEPPLKEEGDDGDTVNGEAVIDSEGLGVTSHTQTEIAEYLKAHPVNEKVPAFSQNPDYTNPPYAAGKLDSATNEAALQMVNNIRYVAGLNADVTLNEDYGKLTQAASLVNFINNKLSHSPTKPDGISDELYELGCQGADQSNIHYSATTGSMTDTIPDSILHGYMADADEYNIEKVGHRRWVLNPSMQSTGFGAVTGPKNGWNYLYSAMYASDSKGSGNQTKVSWPAQQMPVSWFNNNYPWSLSIGKSLDADKVKVELTRTSDNKKWSFSKASADGAFYVENGNYGQKGCIIFRPDSVSYKAGDEFQVNVTGAAADTISYTVTFFDIDAPQEETGGSGTIDDPIKVQLNSTVKQDNLNGNQSDLYYSFNVSKKGYIQPFLRREGAEDGFIDIFIYTESVKDSNLIYKYEKYAWHKKTPVDFSDIGTVGLKPGKYVAMIRTRRSDAYAFKIKYEESEYYEEEQDSSSTPKEIKAGKFYYGEISNDYADRDYYYFKLSKKSKVTLEAEMDDYNGGVAVFKDPAFTEQIISAGKMNPTKTSEIEAGTYYIKVDSGMGGKQIHLAYKFKISTGSSSGGSKKTDPETGTAKINGQEVHSLKQAFGLIKTEGDYEIELSTNMEGEKNLTIPKKATSVTIKGNGNTIRIVGSRITSNTNLKLENVKIRSEKKNGQLSAFTLWSKKGLEIGDNVSFDAAKVTVKSGKELKLSGSLGVNTVTAGSLSLTSSAKLSINKNSKVTVNGEFASEDGARMILDSEFNKPVTLKGKASGKVKFTGAQMSDGKQILQAKKAKLTQDELKSIFDVSGITDNKVNTYLYYYSGGKAGIFGDSINYNNNDYALWKTAVAQMNADKKEGASDLVVTLNGDVNMKGSFRLPKKGYQSLTINGNGHEATFTGNIKLTGNTAISNLTLNKINKKGVKTTGRVIKGKYEYSGPETF